MEVSCGMMLTQAASLFSTKPLCEKRQRINHIKCVLSKNKANTFVNVNLLLLIPCYFLRNCIIWYRDICHRMYAGETRHVPINLGTNTSC